MVDALATELGSRIRQLREAAQMTQADLARLSLKSVETISNFERGKTLPSVRTLVAMAKHLGCSPAEFFAITATDRQCEDAEGRAILRKFGLLSEPDRELVRGILKLLDERARR